MKLVASTLILFIALAPGLACDNETEKDPCGNGIIENEEVCDSLNLHSETWGLRSGM